MSNSYCIANITSLKPRSKSMFFNVREIVRQARIKNFSERLDKLFSQSNEHFSENKNFKLFMKYNGQKVIDHMTSKSGAEIVVCPSLVNDSGAKPDDICIMILFPSGDDVWFDGKVTKDNYKTIMEELAQADSYSKSCAIAEKYMSPEEFSNMDLLKTK